MDYVLIQALRDLWFVRWGDHWVPLQTVLAEQWYPTLRRLRNAEQLMRIKEGRADLYRLRPQPEEDT